LIWLVQFAAVLQNYPKSDGVEEEQQLMPGVSFPNEVTVNQALNTVEVLLSSLQQAKSTLIDLKTGTKFSRQLNLAY